MNPHAIETHVAIRRNAVLGTRARWGRVGFEGAAYAPHELTYRGVRVLHLPFAPVADSGRVPPPGRAQANLFPLICAALYEAAFACEAGPLTTWSN